MAENDNPIAREEAIEEGIKLEDDDADFSQRIEPKSKTGFAVIDTVETTQKNPDKRKTILKPMTIDFPEGSITAIMGPSGGGKTTMLDTLTGNISSGVSVVGEVNLPGTRAYIPQDDRLHGFYTCQAYMKHYARLSGKGINSETETVIDDILNSLGLEEHRETVVGDIFLKGLSGGQKRRLSIALEALSNPENFFLDEPTSGLDSESALQVMKFLSDYVKKAPNRRVILTIHQPSSFIWQLVDNVVLLTKGRLVYQGPRKKIEPFFESLGYPTPQEYNPADHYVTAVNDEFSLHELSAEEWEKAYINWAFEHSRRASFRSTSRAGSIRRLSVRRSASASMLAMSGDYITTNRTNAFWVTLELTKRYFLNLFFNPGILGTRIAMYVMLSLIIGALFWDLGSLSTYSSIQSRIALLFYCVAFFVFMSIAVLPFTVIERAIVNKEVRNGYYHPAVYHLSQAISSVPGTALLALLTTIIIVSMTGLQEPYWYYLNMFLALFCAEALAQLVSHMVPHFIVGMALVAGFYGLFMLLQGFMIVPSEFPGWLEWSYNVAFHTYSWRTFMFNEFHNQIFPDAEEAGFGNGNKILEVYEIESVNPSDDMVVLVCYGIIIHLCSFALLTAKHWQSKRNNVAGSAKQSKAD
eukprot:CAMPEP_0185727946 /NCGR_PEP_ID=MMETSP1171-20130828/3465_1 /TAXON_ID=374046 /ORGANISM="Helicotheca tamensis, Strain CCMP826" /LENGTH=638 /DNA_ID=CAMNT_0028396591 /DNA_START=36 /DNA_END=1952 /DNA_ORIENTATION=+